MPRGSSPGSVAGRGWLQAGAGGSSPGSVARRGWLQAGAGGSSPVPNRAAAGCRGAACWGPCANGGGLHPSAMAADRTSGWSAAREASNAPAASTVLEYLGQCWSCRQGLLCKVAKCSACDPHLAHTKWRRPWPCCCRGMCVRHPLSVLGAGGGGVGAAMPFLHFLHSSKPLLMAASHLDPDTSTAPPMETMGIGHLV